MECGKQLSASTNSCTSCGSVEPFSEKKILDLLKLQIYRLSERKKKNSSQCDFLGTLLLIFLAIIVAGIFFLMTTAIQNWLPYQSIESMTGVTEVAIKNMLSASNIINLLLLISGIKYIYFSYNCRKDMFGKTSDVVQDQFRLWNYEYYKSVLDHTNMIEKNYRDIISSSNFMDEKRKIVKNIVELKKEIELEEENLIFGFKIDPEIKHLYNNVIEILASFIPIFLLSLPSYLLIDVFNIDAKVELFILFSLSLLYVLFVKVGVLIHGYRADIQIYKALEDMENFLKSIIAKHTSK